MDNQNNNPAPQVMELDGAASEQINETRIDPTPIEPEKPFQDPTAKEGSVDDLVNQALSAQQEAEAPKKEPEPAEPTTPPAEETKQVKTPAPEAKLAEKPITPKAATKILKAKSEGSDFVLEELLNSKKVDDSEDDGIHDEPELIVNQILLGNRKDLVKALEQFYPDENSLAKAMKDKSSLYYAVINASANGWNIGPSNTISGVLAQNNKVGDRLTKQTECGIDRIVDGRPRAVHHSTQKVSGKEARLLIRSRLGGLARVNLINSGFWVALRAPQIAELNELFATIDIEGKEIGRTIGAHYALVSDMYLKKKFVEMLISKKIIIESNFIDIYKNGAFIRNLSFHDYDVLMHCVVSLMARNGMRLRMVCPKCGKISVEENIDISSCKMINMDLMTDKRHDPNVVSVSEWWQQAGRNEKGELIYRTEEDLRYYRNQVLNQECKVRQEYTVDGQAVKFDIVMQVPTMWQFIQVGQSIIDSLNNTINSIANGDTDKDALVRAAMTIQGFQLITPWVKELVVYADPECKTIDFTTDDSQVIMEYLDTTIQEGQTGDMFEELNKFVANTRFNYIGSYSLECPQCHNKPESGLDNFYPMEIETIFFGLLFRLLPSG